MNMLHVNIHVIILHADIDGSHVNIIMLHVAVSRFFFQKGAWVGVSENFGKAACIFKL